ncbi:BtrH N-terminal domain-containing protein [Paenibacillus chitinolyticus]|uniref:BtrH N-terminal domain-containing protein n=1 Tax=Paenibacillus chitinolyticus TaxID=79263 RepID=UPI002DB991BE|nr:BtrH N-terminal domain-containing protein [Paenibacillus chitinolyticus]MEC0248509.1 BtrH N-terminal domain-containing protein [Paenibacillus chitinolyticus]
MQLKRVPYGNKLLNCFEHMIVSAASMWDRDEPLHFACSWGFEFKSREEEGGKSVGERLYNGSYPDRDLAYHIERYFGIRLNTHRPRNTGELADLVRRELGRNQPTGVEMDSLWCPFHPVYRKQSLPHNFLITAFDEAGGKFDCIDSLFSDRTESIDFFHLEQASVICYTFDRLDPFIPPHWSGIARDAASCMLDKASGENAFDAMRRFAGEVSEGLDVQAELEQYPWLQTAPLFLQLHTIAVNRYKFSETLACLHRTSGVEELKELSGRLYECGDLWQTAEHLILKSYYMKNRAASLEKVGSRILRLADAEEELARRLYELGAQAQADEACGAHEACEMHKAHKAHGAYGLPGGLQ